MNRIECLEFKPMIKGLLLGFAKIYVVNWGLEINQVAIFNKNDKRWVGLPSRDYIDPSDGEKKYVPYIRFREKLHSDAFSRHVLEAVDRFRMKENRNEDRQLSLFSVHEL